MNLEYNKVTRTINILGVEEYLEANLATSVLLFIDDVEVGYAEAGHICTTDGIRKVTLKSYDDDGLIETIELGYVLTIEYSKDKNRSFLVNILDNTNYYDILSPTYSKNRKIIREIEFSFYSGNIKRVEILLSELKWN